MLRNIVSTYGARLASMLATFVLLPVVSHGTGAQAYGLYALTVAMGLLFQQDLGMSSATTKFVAEAWAGRDAARVRSLSATTLAYFLILGVVAAGGCAFALHLVLQRAAVPAELSATTLPLLLCGTSTVLLALLISPVRQILSGLGSINVVNCVLMGQALLRIVLTVGAMWAGMGIVWVALIDVLSLLAAGAGMALYLRTRYPDLRYSLKEARFRTFREIFGLSSQLLLLGIGSAVVLQSGSVIASLALPLGATALYAVAQRAYALVKEVTSSLSVALLPIASREQALRGDRANQELYILGTKFANIVMAIVLVLLLAFSPELITAWAGDQLAAAVLPAQILLVSLLANNNHLLAIPVLTASNSIRVFGWLHIGWAVSAVVLGCVLAPRLGVAGIALGVAVPVFVLEPLYVRHALRVLGVPARRFLVECLLRPFLPLLLPAVLVYAVSAQGTWGLGGIVTVGAAWAVVALAVAWFFSCTPADREAVRSSLRRRG